MRASGVCYYYLKIDFFHHFLWFLRLVAVINAQSASFSSWIAHQAFPCAFAPRLPSFWRVQGLWGFSTSNDRKYFLIQFFFAEFCLPFLFPYPLIFAIFHGISIPGPPDINASSFAFYQPPGVWYFTPRTPSL